MNREQLSCGVQESRVSEISRALLQMEQAVSRMEMIAREVGEKFAPVLIKCTQDPQSVGGVPPSPPCSELASTIRSHAERIEAFGADLAKIINCCDL